MNDEVRDLSAAEERMQQLIDDHEETVKRLQEEMERSVRAMADRFEKLAFGADKPPPEPEPEPTPEIRWLEPEDKNAGRLLVMNELAANQLIVALDTLADVLPKIKEAVVPKTSHNLLAQLLTRK